MKLYDIPMEFAALEMKLIETDGELTPELEQEFDALLKGSKDKIEAACCVIRQLEADALTAKNEAQRLTNLSKTRENGAENLKARVLYALDTAFSGKLKTPRFTIWGQNAVASIDIQVAPDADLEKMAGMYPDFVRTEYSLDREAIRRAFKEQKKTPDIRRSGVPNSILVEEKEPTRFLRIK